MDHDKVREELARGADHDNRGVEGRDPSIMAAASFTPARPLREAVGRARRWLLQMDDAVNGGLGLINKDHSPCKD